MRTDLAAFGMVIAALDFGSPVDVTKFDAAKYCVQDPLYIPMMARDVQEKRDEPNYGNSTTGTAEPTLQVCSARVA